jgi:hypothetical protein
MSSRNDADARTQDEREIRAIVDRMFGSWARGDAVAYHADLTDEADNVAFDGARRGKADSIRSHEHPFRNTRVRPLSTSGPMVELGGRFVRWRTDWARRKPGREGG